MSAADVRRPFGPRHPKPGFLLALFFACALGGAVGVATAIGVFEDRALGRALGETLHLRSGVDVERPWMIRCRSVDSGGLFIPHQECVCVPP